MKYVLKQSVKQQKRTQQNVQKTYKYFRYQQVLVFKFMNIIITLNFKSDFTGKWFKIFFLYFCLLLTLRVVTTCPIVFGSNYTSDSLGI